MNNDDHYQSLTSRNYMYVSHELQARIRKTKLIFFGTGLSSNIILQAVRLGFERLFLCDGDHVEGTNLNRQQYFHSDQGKYKVEVIKDLCMSINPHCMIESHRSYLEDPQQHLREMDESSIVINTVDCGQVYFDLTEIARQKTLVICPFNPGYSGFVICFNKESQSIYQHFNTECAKTEHEISHHILETHNELYVREMTKKSASEFIEIVEKTGFYPQIAIGASYVAALVNHIILNHLTGEPIKTSPETYSIGGRI
jgi:molybdopterin-synthase adenylyltransferase